MRNKRPLLRSKDRFTVLFKRVVANKIWLYVTIAYLFSAGSYWEVMGKLLEGETADICQRPKTVTSHYGNKEKDLPHVRFRLIAFH